jgi:26S proteasome regulatory subunit N10
MVENSNVSPKVLLSSPVITPDGEAAAMGGGGGGDAGAFEFGVDPAADPELAMALRY